VCVILYTFRNKDILKIKYLVHVHCLSRVFDNLHALASVFVYYVQPYIVHSGLTINCINEHQNCLLLYHTTTDYNSYELAIK